MHWEFRLDCEMAFSFGASPSSKRGKSIPLHIKKAPADGRASCPVFLAPAMRFDADRALSGFSHATHNVSRYFRDSIPPGVVEA
jgi:hypothetical protein